MAYEMKPLSCSPSQLKGFSEKLIVSHYENNYGGAVKLGTASILIGAGALGVLLFHLGFAPVRALPLVSFSC
jgi:hypothetical protein